MSDLSVCISVCLSVCLCSAEALRSILGRETAAVSNCSSLSAATWRIEIISIQHVYCIRQLAALFALYDNGKESFNPILDPDADPDHHKCLITSKLGQVKLSLKILSKPTDNSVSTRASKRTYLT